MSNEQHQREQVAELAGIYIETLNRGHGIISRFEQGNRAADAILAAGYVKRRTITTVEECVLLPIGSVLLTHLGGVFTKHYDRFHESENWEAKGAMSFHPRDLPATVLHEGAL